MTKFDAFNPAIPLSSSPPEYPTMERKLKKPMMERKRRKRMNTCFDALKDLLLQSDLQQSSKLEKADVLEKTVAYVTNLQRENRALQQQIQQILHTDPGQTYQNGMREGFSVCATATSDVLGRMPLPPPFAAPEFRNMLRHELSERLSTLLARGNNISNRSTVGSPSAFLPTTSAADSTLRRVPMPSKKIMPPSFDSLVLPSFVKADGKEVFQAGLAMHFPFAAPPFNFPPAHFSREQQYKPKRADEVDDFVVVDVESCDTTATYSQQTNDDSGISSPPTALPLHNKSVEQDNCGQDGQGAYNQTYVPSSTTTTTATTGSFVYRSTSSQKKQRKEVWKPYERF